MVGAHAGLASCDRRLGRMQHSHSSVAHQRIGYAIAV
jgi:hypothetical protein